MFSYELALGLSWVGVIMLAGSFRIARHRGAPGGLASGTGTASGSSRPSSVYMIAATAEVNRTPFDLPEAETELVAGFHTEYSSMRFALLQMAEYVNMITVSAVGANLFFGGWHFADPAACPTRRCGSSLKMLAVLFFFIWLRGTRAPLPLRPAHALRLEGAGAAWPCPEHPRDRGRRLVAPS